MRWLWLLVLTACGGMEEMAPPAVLDTRAPDICVLEASPSRVWLELDEQATVRVRARNTHCVVRRIFLDRSTFQVANEPDAPFVVRPGEPLDLVVVHEPTRELPKGPSVRELLLEVQEGTSASVLITAPSPPDPCIAVRPASIDFGPVAQGETKTITAAVSGNCTEPALILEARTANNSDFSVQMLTSTRISSERQLPLLVRFHPSAVGIHRSKLEVFTNERGSNTHVVQLTGLAVR